MSFVISEDRARDLVFEIVLGSKIRERLHLSVKFYVKFGMQDESLKNKLDYTKLSRQIIQI